MTPKERGERAARICSCKSCRPRLARVVEAEIREAAKGLVEALTEALDVGDGAWLVDNGDDEWIRRRGRFVEELAKWA